MNKYILITLLAMLAWSCKTHKAITKVNPTFRFYPNVISISEQDSIGLYYFRKDTATLLWGGCNIFVALKTPKKIIFPSTHLEQRKKQVSRFLVLYGHLFSEEEAKKIEINFNEGNINENGPCVNF